MPFTFVLAKKCPPLLLYPLLFSPLLCSSNGTLKASVQMVLYLVTLVRNQDEHEFFLVFVLTSCAEQFNKCCWVSLGPFQLSFILVRRQAIILLLKWKYPFLRHNFDNSADTVSSIRSPYQSISSRKKAPGWVYGLWTSWNFQRAEDIFLRNSELKQS